MHMAHKSGNTSGLSKSSSDLLNYTGFPWDVCKRSLMFCLETKIPWRQTPSRKKKAVVFTTVTTNAYQYQDQINAGFSKVCEIFKVCGIESLKYVQEFYTPVCYCGDISTPQNVTLSETNCDWLFDMSLMGRPWPMKATIHSRPSAVSLKVWLCETNTDVWSVFSVMDHFSDQCTAYILGLVRIPFLSFEASVVINIEYRGRGLNIFFSLIKAGISVCLSVCLHFYYVENRSSSVFLRTQGSAVSHYGAIWTRNTFRINTLLINYRTARAVRGALHAGRAYMLRERTLH